LDDWYRWQGEDLVLQLRLQPGASRSGWGEPLDDALKVRVHAPPVDGKANAELIAFVARAFRVGRSRVCIESGQRARLKRIRVTAPVVIPAVLPIVR
jgi:uncharacterized protein (TIGR00251 family)